MAQSYKESGKENKEGKWSLNSRSRDKDKEKGCWGADMAYTRNIPPGASMTRELTGTKFSRALVPGIALPIMGRSERYAPCLWAAC